MTPALRPRPVIVGVVLPPLVPTIGNIVDDVGRALDVGVCTAVEDDVAYPALLVGSSLISSQYLYSFRLHNNNAVGAPKNCSVPEDFNQTKTVCAHGQVGGQFLR